MALEDRHRLDRAAWRRYSTDNKDRCIVCGHHADVNITLLAMHTTPNVNDEGEKTRGGVNVQLAKQQFRFCSEHGQLRFGEALNRLNATGGKS